MRTNLGSYNTLDSHTSDSLQWLWPCLRKFEGFTAMWSREWSLFSVAIALLTVSMKLCTCCSVKRQLFSFVPCLLLVLKMGFVLLVFSTLDCFAN